MTFGITVMPEYIQSEGIDAVLDRLEGAGIRQVATSPYIMIPTEEGVGHREPPIDAGSGKVRLLDRPLWGKNELWFRTSPSFAPQLDLYEGLRYQPPPCEGEPDTILHEFISAAASRGIEVYFQIMAAIPPALRVQFGGPLDEDKPCLPDGSHPVSPLSNNASLASPEILAYTQALTHDLLMQYPDIAGIRFDWPEYPCYHLDTVFTDFNPQVASFAKAQGFDFEAIQSAAGNFFTRLQNLNDSDLNCGHFFALADDVDQIMEWLALKRSLVTHYTQALCDSVHRHGKMAVLHAFPPPLSALTGFDFATNSEHADAIGMKLYTMHLPMILHNYGRQMLDWNPGLDEALLTSSLNRWLDLADEPLPTLDAYAYPPPEQNHPISNEAQARKIQLATDGAAKVHIMPHTYGPPEDFARRLRVAVENSPEGIWLNRYAYLDDEKYKHLLAQAALRS